MFKGDLEGVLKGYLEVDLEVDLEGDFREDFKQDLDGDLLSSSGPGLVQYRLKFNSFELDSEVEQLVIVRI